MSRISRRAISTNNQRRLRILIVLSTPAVFLLSLALSASGVVQIQSPVQTRELTPKQKPQLPVIKLLSLNIRQVARILRTEGVPIEAGLLFSRNGRKKLRPQLNAMHDMQVSKLYSEPLRGVVMADRLTLGEKLKIETDTVIIANHVVFAGRDPLIKGPHDFHLFPLESVRAERGRGTVITIDTSGAGRKEWIEAQVQQANTRAKTESHIVSNHVVASAEDTSGLHGIDGNMGMPGTNGDNGGNGSNGDGGSCTTTKAGENGDAGSNGAAGGIGGPGTHGTNGQAAGNQTLPIGDVNAGSFAVIARGGHGGNGGPGGFGGFGGRGGNGGNGGDGAGCNCDSGGIGDGGRGGAAGTGGPGGNGSRFT